MSITTESADPRRARDLREKIIRYRRDCGCALAAIFFLASASLYTLYLFTRGHFGWRTPFVGIGIALACAIAGKMTGIGIARIKLRLVQKHVARHDLRLDLNN